MPGRPRKPVELKRLNARSGTRDAGGRLIPAQDATVELVPATEVPEPPANLKESGLILWEKAWTHASRWLSLKTDFLAVERACRLADMEHLTFELAASDPGARGYVTRYLETSAELASALSALGFDPSSRSRLGVAEVKAQSTLERIKLDRERAGKGGN